MTTPVTDLDPRYSDADATAADWDATRRRLQEAQHAWLVTVRPDGRPHVTPLVAVWHGDAGYVCAGPDEQKARHLRANPNVVLLVGDDRWDGGTDVVVEGRAEPVTDEDLLRELAAAWAQKWDGRWRFEVADGAFRHDAGRAVVYRVTPRKVLAFGKGRFSQTRHLFPDG
jgi:PPOX class probable F420-dependent enzyme